MENIIPSLSEENKKEPILTPADLVKRHMQDPTHVVTDEELRNVKVGDDAEDEKEVNKEADAKEDEIEKLPNNDDLPNPYEVLG